MALKGRGKKTKGKTSETAAEPEAPASAPPDGGNGTETAPLAPPRADTEPQAPTPHDEAPTPQNGAQSVLERYAVGPDVERLQHLLNGRGFRLRVNGVFDLDTHNALVEYQGRAELPRTGVVDAAVWAALEER